jgi:hypothetical protein
MTNLSNTTCLSFVIPVLCNEEGKSHHLKQIQENYQKDFAKRNLKLILRNKIEDLSRLICCQLKRYIKLANYTT